MLPAGSGEAAVARAAAAVALQLNVTKQSAMPACLIADVELSFQGRSLLQSDDDNSWNQGIASKLPVPAQKWCQNSLSDNCSWL